MNRGFVLETEQWFPEPLGAIFDFFADAGNLQAITPPWLDFRIVTPLPIAMHEGTLIDYRLKLHRIPVRWRTRIARWEPPYEFVDEQVRGPYLRWVHRHTFESVDDGTRVRDRVEYAVPGGTLAHKLFVERDVRRIFEYRGERLADLFGGTESGRQRLEMFRGERAAA